MLTIQPNFTHFASKKVSFKGEYDNFTDEQYNAKKAYYQNSMNDFDTLLKDDFIPDKLKKPLKYGKIAAGSLLEGWAVFWAANKGTGFIKNSFVKSANSQLAKEIGDITKPAKKGLREACSKLSASIKNGMKNIQKSKFMTSISNMIEKLDKSTVGHALVSVVKGIGKAFKATGNGIYNITVKPIKKLNYDKVANATSTTLGVGCGVAGAYSELRKPDEKKAEAKKANENEITDEVSEAIEDDPIEGEE